MSGVVLGALILDKLRKCLKLVNLRKRRCGSEVTATKMFHVMLVHCGITRNKTQKFYSLYNLK